MSDKATCAVMVYRNGYFRSERCDKPCKGVRTTPDDVMWPVCGIHLRNTRYGMVEVRPGRFSRLRERAE